MNPVQRGIIVGLFTVAIGAVGWAWTTTTDRMDQADLRHDSEILSLSERVRATEERFEDISRRLERIENKLDQVRLDTSVHRQARPGHFHAFGE